MLGESICKNRDKFLKRAKLTFHFFWKLKVPPSIFVISTLIIDEKIVVKNQTDLILHEFGRGENVYLIFILMQSSFRIVLFWFSSIFWPRVRHTFIKYFQPTKPHVTVTWIVTSRCNANCDYVSENLYAPLKQKHRRNLKRYFRLLHCLSHVQTKKCTVSLKLF